MFLVGWLIGCFVVGIISVDGKYGFWGGFFLSFVISPVIGIIIVLMADNTKKKEESIIEEIHKVAKENNPSTREKIQELKEMLEEGLIDEDDYKEAVKKVLGS